MRQSHCWTAKSAGLYSSIVNDTLWHSIVLTSHACALGLAFLSFSGRAWYDVPQSGRKRIGIFLLAIVILIAGVVSWATMEFRCHGS